MKKIILLSAVVLTLSALTCYLFFRPDKNDPRLTSLLHQVEKLNLTVGGFTLGKPLTASQMETAEKHPEEAAAPGTFKFHAEPFHIVADRKTKCVLVIYEHFKNASHKRIQKLVGDLFLQFQAPTVFNHNKVIYWVYGKNGGKLSENTYAEMKKNKQKLPALATIKLVSDMDITGAPVSNQTADAYYILSSNPVLKIVQSRLD